MRDEKEKYRIYVDGSEDSYTLVDDYNDMFTEAWALHEKGHSVRVTEALVRHVEIMSIPKPPSLPK